MGDIQRFLRYVMPGFIFFLEISLLFGLSFPQKVGPVINDVLLRGILGPTFAVLITSGGIGFFFSIIHHLLCNCECCFFRRYGVNHYGVLNRAIGWKHISLREYGRDRTITIPATALTKRGAWRIVSSLWHGSGLISKSAIQQLSRLSSNMNGVGTSFVGSIIALLLWFIIHLVWSCPFSCWGFFRGLFLSVIFISILWLDYRRVLEHTQGFVEIVLAKKLYEHYYRNNKRPMDIFIFTRDYRVEKEC